MSQANGYHPLRIEYSGAVLRDVRELGEKARLAGRAAEFHGAFTEFTRRAPFEAKSLGEPVQELRAMRLQLRKLVLGRLTVEYGVRYDLPLVFARRVAWSP